MTRITGIKLIDSYQTIQRRINRAFADEMNDRLKASRQKIEDAIANNIGRIFVNSPEYASLTGQGLLSKHFGIPQNDAISKLDVIINTLASSVKVTHRKVTVVNNQFSGGLTVYAFLADFSDILSLDEGKVVTNKGQSLPWLQWLTIEGDKIIITGYDVLFGTFPSSRAGGVIMTKTNQRAWRVPPEFSGDADNNWIIRAIDDSLSYIENLISGAIRQNL